MAYDNKELYEVQVEMLLFASLSICEDLQAMRQEARTQPGMTVDQAFIALHHSFSTSVEQTVEDLKRVRKALPPAPVDDDDAVPSAGEVAALRTATDVMASVCIMVGRMSTMRPDWTVPEAMQAVADSFKQGMARTIHDAEQAMKGAKT